MTFNFEKKNGTYCPTGGVHHADKYLFHTFNMSEQAQLCTHDCCVRKFSDQYRFWL